MYTSERSKSGDKLVTSIGKTIAVDEVVVRKTKGTVVYNFEVENAHTYYVFDIGTPKGSIYVEFDVNSDSLVQDDNKSWSQIPGHGSSLID
ncbi:polymorphic toxin-type HINT domain-containing protein [Floricoccus tropicus]|uniref:polymorphic toxin-type HINT domain-containing protein n=1 Tax=Floricoccus tropicus TaxID=1859473 RepID=UPI0009F251E8|nr:polymorphic toxin-type HINT domain-containing protein [Floricoccus tropicus]